MIRRENRAKVEFGTVGVFTKTPVIWVTLPTSAREWRARIDGTSPRRRSRQRPPRLGARGNARGRDSGSSPELSIRRMFLLTQRRSGALIIEQHLKEQARLARATATADRAAPSLWTRAGRDPARYQVGSLEARRGRCVNCGSNGNLEFDHVIPVSMGGAHTVRNLQLLCVSCNVAKGGNLA